MRLGSWWHIIPHRVLISVPASSHVGRSPQRQPSQILKSAILLQFAHKSTTTLPRISSLEFRPRTHTAGFNAQVSLPAIFRLEVAHSLDFVGPAIPYRHVGKRVAGHDKDRFASLGDCQGYEGGLGLVVCGRSVDSVGLAGEGDGGGGLGEGLGSADFVDVRRGGEAFDCGFVDILGRKGG